MLFDEYQYFDYQFPEPQYLGAKHTHLSWINKYIPNNVKTAVDAFAGSQSVAFLLKQRGFKTITNDFLSFNNQIGKALIENNIEKLTKKDVTLLLQPAPNKKDFELMENTFTDVFFEKSEAEFLDNFRANISLLEGNYRKSILDSSTAFELSLTNYLKRNLKIDQPLLDEFLRLNNSISKKRSILRLIGISLPNHNYSDDLENLRNRAIHIGKEPNSDEARKAFLIATEVVNLLSRERIE